MPGRFRTRKPKIPREIRELDKYVVGPAIRKRIETSLPDRIIVDVHGTWDWQNTGVGIPTSALVAIKKLGKDVIVYSSSGKFKDIPVDIDAARKVLAQYGIPLITDEKKAFSGAASGVVIGDKPSDQRRAAKWGMKFLSVGEFTIEKVISTRPDFTAQKVLTHPQQQVCTCEVRHPGKPHQTSVCDCRVSHPLR